jgi:hypothetical protein
MAGRGSLRQALESMLATMLPRQRWSRHDDATETTLVTAQCRCQAWFLRRRLGDKAGKKLRHPGRLIFPVLFFFPFLFPISLLFQAFF